MGRARRPFRLAGLVAVLIALALPGEPVRAQPAAEVAQYENLMDALAAAESRQAADVIAARIWNIWLTAPDDTAQEVLDAALEARRSYDFLGALNHLDRLVEHYPGYAEGWNQRATIHFLRGDFDASLADVDRVLAIEPRHFGALSGKAIILFEQGQVGLAQIVVREALKHHPFLREKAILDAGGGTDL